MQVSSKIKQLEEMDLFRSPLAILSRKQIYSIKNPQTTQIVRQKALQNQSNSPITK